MLLQAKESNPANIYKLFRAVVKRQRCIENGDSILCAVSGGLDSMVLASLLVSLKKDIPFDLSLSHVNYGLRGKESDAQEKLVYDFAERHHLKCFATKASLEKKEGENFQNQARDFRYHYFAEVAAQIKAGKVAVAHHLEDQVETILGHLLRGSSIRGLGGMKAVRALPGKAGIQLIRPLLSFSKKTLELYAEQNNVETINDSSNFSDKYWRNRLRMELLPVIQNLRPQSFGKIVRLSHTLQELTGYLEEEAKQWLHEFAKKEPAHFWMPRPRFIQLPRVLRLEILRWAFTGFNGSQAELKADHLLRCDWIARSEKQKGAYRLPQKICFERSEEDLILSQLL